MKTRIVLVIWGLLALLISVSCSQQSPYAIQEQQHTPLAATSAPTALPPTSTAAPTSVNTMALPDMQQALKYLEANRYEEAISLLNSLYGRFHDDQTVREQLANAYLKWGTALIRDGSGDAQSVGSGLDKFISGLVVAPTESTVANNLRTQQERSKNYLSLVEALKEQMAVLKNTKEVGPELRTNLDKLVNAAQQIYKPEPPYPAYTSLYTQTLLVAGEVYGRSKGANNKETDTLAERSETLCKAVLDADKENAAAKVCVKNAHSRRLALTPAPTAAPTSPAQRPPEPPRRPAPAPAAAACLRFRVLNYNDSPNHISVRIVGISTAGWTLTVDGLGLQASFGGGDARVAGLGDRQEVTITVRDEAGRPVCGGAGIPSRGSAIMQANWR